MKTGKCGTPPANVCGEGMMLLSKWHMMIVTADERNRKEPGVTKNNVNSQHRRGFCFATIISFVSYNVTLPMPETAVNQ